MGYPMAVNLRTKMEPGETLLICDVSEDAIKRFQAQTEGKGTVGVVKNGFDAVQAAVCLTPFQWEISFTDGSSGEHNHHNASW